MRATTRPSCSQVTSPQRPGATASSHHGCWKIAFAHGVTPEVIGGAQCGRAGMAAIHVRTGSFVPTVGGDLRDGRVGGSVMRNRVTVRATLVLVAFAFGVAFAIQPPLGGESSAQRPTVQDRPRVVTDAPGPDVALSPAARQVPALRDARRKT